MTWRRIAQVRLRLIDAAALAACALLALKLIGLAADPVPGPRPPDAEGGVAAAGDLPAFARVLAKARTNYAVPDVTMTGAVPPKDEKEPGAKPSPPAAGASGVPSERALLERLGERRETLQQRDRDLDTRERLLENAERKLEGRINELRALEKADASAAKRGEAETSALKGVVTMYETMKPKEAARVFDRLALDVLVPVVLQMNPRKMAEVLAAMQPESAEKLTVALASRARGLDSRAASANAALPPTELPSIDPAPAGKAPR